MHHTERIDISDIETVVCDDFERRYVLNSSDKIIRWINYHFHLQEESGARPDLDSLGIKYIELSNCIISTCYHNGEPKGTRISDIAGEIDCIRNMSEKSVQYRYEVLEYLRCCNSIVYGLDIQNTIFRKMVNFENSKFLNHAYLGFCCYEDLFFAQKAYFSSVSFNKAICNDRVLFDESTFEGSEISFIGSKFNKNVSFDGIQFIEKRNNTDLIDENESSVTFAESEFGGRLSVKNVKLERNCFLNMCVFNGDTIFSDLECSKKIVLNDSRINSRLYLSTDGLNSTQTINNLELNGTVINGLMNVNKCRIENFSAHLMEVAAKGILRIVASEIECLDMSSICNNGHIFFDNNKKGIKKITLISSVNNGFIELENTAITNIENRKTARILKDSAYKSNNTIDALYYKSMEMELFRKELNQKLIFESIPEIVLIYLNKWSNNFGLSWSRGIVFTIVSAFFFYTLYSLSINSTFSINWFIIDADYWKKVMEFLWLPDGFKELKDGLNTSLWSYIWFISGKIFVAYGIYQTISAFRKYGK